MQTPDHDATMMLLGSVLEEMSYRDFSAVVADPQRLREWIKANLILPPEETKPLDPEDPVVAERAGVSADAEEQALELWGQIKPEQRKAIKAAFLDLYGREGAATLPMSLD